MTSAVSAKTVSAIETRPQPRDGKQSRADAFRATLDGVAATDAGSTGRAGLTSATNALPEGYSRPLAGLGQQVIRLSVAAEAKGEETAAGQPSLGREKTSGTKGLPASSLASHAEAAKGKNEAPIDLKTSIASDEIATEDAEPRDVAAEASTSDAVEDDVPAEARDTTKSEAETRGGGTAIAQLTAALMVPARDLIRTGWGSEDDRSGAAEGGSTASGRGEGEEYPRVDKEHGAGQKVVAAETSTTTARTGSGSALHSSEPPKIEVNPKQADPPAISHSASPREVTGQPVLAARSEARVEIGRSSSVSEPVVDAPEVRADVTRTSTSARDAAAVAKADAITVSTARPDEMRPAQTARPSEPNSNPSPEAVEIVAGTKQPVAQASVSGADPAIARAGIMSSPNAPMRAEPARSSRAVISETKPQATGATSTSSSESQLASADVNTALRSELLPDGNDEAETLRRDIAQIKDEPVEQASVESGSRDTGRGLNTASGTAAAPLPASATSATPATPAAAVLDAIRSEAAWTAQLGNTRSAAPGEVKSLKINLSPVELGSVVAHLTINDESVSVALTAETSEAQSRLAADTDAIVKSLRAIGLEVDRITVQLAPRADAPAQADTGAGARQQGFAADSGAGDARGQSSGSQAGRNASAAEDPAVRTDTSTTPNRNASSRYI